MFQVILDSGVSLCVSFSQNWLWSECRVHEYLRDAAECCKSAALSTRIPSTYCCNGSHAANSYLGLTCFWSLHRCGNSHPGSMNRSSARVVGSQWLYRSDHFDMGPSSHHRRRCLKLFKIMKKKWKEKKNRQNKHQIKLHENKGYSPSGLVSFQWNSISKLCLFYFSLTLPEIYIYDLTKIVSRWVSL